MSMDIGGVDLPLTEVSRKAYDARLILAEIAACWPDSVFESLADERTQPVGELLKEDKPIRSEEFFVYRNQASAADWERKGATGKNANDMIHVIATASRRAGRLDITMVIGDITPEMGRLYWTIDNALAAAKNGGGVARRSQRREALAAELVAAGSSLSATALADLASSVRAALYPRWTVDELACHPQDALQFCEAVRTRAGVPIPDHLIMRALLDRRQRVHPQSR